MLDSARLLVGPENHALYVLDSHTSEGYVGHDTLTGDLVLVGKMVISSNCDSPRSL